MQNVCCTTPIGIGDKGRLRVKETRMHKASKGKITADNNPNTFESLMFCVFFFFLYFCMYYTYSLRG